MTDDSTALVIAAADVDEIDTLPAADVVIAADSGADIALSLGRPVDVVVGDMDSISPAALAAARGSGARIVEHAPDKDETDLELALSMAVTTAAFVHVVVGAAGRLDHSLANLAVLASPRWEKATIDATVGRHHVTVIRGERRIEGRVGELVSLMPVGGPAVDVTTEGLAYALRGETLEPYSGRGISNVIESVPVVVSVQEGVVLAIRPLEPTSGHHVAPG